MPALLARSCHRHEGWAEAKLDAVPLSVILDLAAPDGDCSVWLVEQEDESQLLRVAAALLSNKDRRAEAATFRFISKWYLKKHNIAITQTPGNSIDDELNRSGSHFEIKIQTVEEAIETARGFISQEGILRVVTEDQIYKMAARSIKDKRVKVKNLSYDLLSHLIDNNYLAL